VNNSQTTIEGVAVPKRRRTSKRDWVAGNKAVPWTAPKWVRPKLPTAPLWRTLVLQGRYVLDGLVEKPIPRAVPVQPTERTIPGRSAKDDRALFLEGFLYSLLK